MGLAAAVVTGTGVEVGMEVKTGVAVGDALADALGDEDEPQDTSATVNDVRATAPSFPNGMAQVDPR